MITLYNENDVRIKDIEVYEWNDAEMGESTISCTVMFDSVIPFHPDWYVLYNGEKYILGLTAPNGKEGTTRINEEYSLVFHSSREELKRYTFMDFVEYGSNNPQPSRHTFTVASCTLRQLVDRFNINLKYYLGDTWRMVLSADADENITADLSFDIVSLWDVLLNIYQNYNVRWKVANIGGVMTITVGADAVVLDTILEYGKGNGLISVERTNPTERIVTRLRGKGSDKNLPANYFHTGTNAFPIPDPDTNPVLQNIFFNKLYPKNYRDYVRGYNSGEHVADESWAYGRGVEDKVAGRPMNIVDFVKSDNEDLWGISYGAIEDTDEIFPTLQGAERDGVRLDEVLAVSPIYVDAPDLEAPEGAWTKVEGNKWQTFTSGNDDKLLSALYVVKESSKFTLPNPINTVKMKFRLIVTQVAAHQANSHGITTPASPIMVSINDLVQNGWSVNIRLRLEEWREGLPHTVREWNASEEFVDIELDDVPVGEYSFSVYLKLLRFNNSAYRNDYLWYTFESELYGIEYREYQTHYDQEKFSETFDIWIRNVWNSEKRENESDEDYAYRVWLPLVFSEDMTVMFSDGLLAGEDYEFAIVGSTIDQDNLREVITRAIHYDTSVEGSHWRLTLQKSDAELDASGKYLPNSVISAVPGNHFFFINIQMPYDPYVYDAERRLQGYLEDELALLDVELPTFAVQPSSVFMATFSEADKVIPGNKIRLRNAELIGNAYMVVYIQSVTKKYTVNKINPDWSLVVSDEIVAKGSPLSVLDGKIEVLSAQVYSNKQAVRDAIEAWSAFFLRKDGLPDSSYSPTDFYRRIKLHDDLLDHDFRKGDFGGQGMGIYRDSNGNRVLETDFIIARMGLHVNDLSVEHVEHIGGQKIYSPASMSVIKVDETDAVWRCYFDTKYGLVPNMFVVGDFAFCQTFKGTETGGYTTYWAKVVGVGADYIEISKADMLESGTGTPAVGDTIIQLGNESDVNRQSAIVISSYGENSPSIKMFHGIDSYSLNGKDMFGVEYNSDSEIPFFYNYGSMLLGSRPGSDNPQFIYYDHKSGTLTIRASVNFLGGSSGLENIPEYGILKGTVDTVAEVIAAIDDDSILDLVEKRVVRREWETINGLASTTQEGTTGSYHQTITDFEEYAFPTSASVFTFNGITYTHADKALVFGAIGISDLTDKYLSLRGYLDQLNLYSDDPTEEFDPDELSDKLIAYYDAEQYVRNQIALDNKQKFDSLGYIKSLLTPNQDITAIEGGVVLSTIIGVRSDDILVAGLNSSVLGRDDEHGTLMIFAGAADAEGVNESKFRVYEDGHVVANDLIANGAKFSNADVDGKITAKSGSIGNFDIVNLWLSARGNISRTDGTDGTDGTYDISFSAAGINIESNNFPISSTDYSNSYLSIIDCSLDGRCKISSYPSAWADQHPMLYIKSDFTHPSGSNPSFINIGIYINVKGAANSYRGLFGEEVGGNYAILCENGLFAGLRPKIRTIGTTNAAEWELTQYDHTVYITKNGTLKFPANPILGQEYIILKPQSTSFSMNIQGQNMSWVGFVPSELKWWTAALFVYTEGRWIGTVLTYKF